MVQRRAKECFELLFARKSVRALHGDQTLTQGRQRQRHLERRLVAEPSVCLACQ